MARFRTVSYQTTWRVSGIGTAAGIRKRLKESMADSADMWHVPLKDIKVTDVFWDGRYASAVIYVI